MSSRSDRALSLASPLSSPRPITAFAAFSSPPHRLYLHRHRHLHRILHRQSCSLLLDCTLEDSTPTSPIFTHPPRCLSTLQKRLPSSTIRRFYHRARLKRFPFPTSPRVASSRVVLGSRPIVRYPYPQGHLRTFPPRPRDPTTHSDAHIP